MYDGVPDYVAAVRSDFGAPGFVHRGLAGLPVYHLIARGEDIDEAENSEVPDDNVYRWPATLVLHCTDPVTGEVERAAAPGTVERRQAVQRLNVAPVKALPQIEVGTRGPT